MASTPTTRLRLEKQALGENSATWGAPKLNDVFDRLDEAIGGVESISISGGTTTLSSANYSTDQARKAVLVFSGTLASAASVIVPNVEKTYLCVNNCTLGAYTLTVKTAAGTGYVLRSGPNWVYCDATNVSGAVPRLDQAPAPTAAVDLNSQRITTLGTPSASTDAATKAYVDAAVSTVGAVNLASSDGTALAPTYSWASDSNTGMYRVGADSLGLTAGGTVRATLSTAGLAVTGTLSASGAMTASAGLAVTGALSTTGAASVGAGLGVTGTATVGSTLAVAGAITATAGMTAAAPVLTAAGSAAAPSHSFSGDPDTGVYSGGANILALATGGTVRATISAAGDIGVSSPTITPSADTRFLTIKAPNSGLGYASLRLQAATTTNEAVIQCSGTAADLVMASAGSVSAQATTFATIVTAGSERGRWTDTGELLVGQASSIVPGYGNTTVGTSLQAAGRLFVSAASGGFSNWNLNGIGSLLTFSSSATTVGGISVTTTTTAFNTSSDYRLKTNVEALTGAVSRLAGLKPSRFRFKTQAAGAPKIDGFLAHEVSSVVPEAVTGVKDAATMQQLDLSKLVPLLVAAVQELAVRLTAAEAALPPGKTK